MPNEKQNPAITPESENYGLPENFVPVDVPPIIPSNIVPNAGAAANPYKSGTLNPNLSLQQDVVNAGSYPPGVPSIRLMPVGAAGNASSNAAIKSIAQTIVNETVENLTPAAPTNNISTVTAAATSLASGSIAQSTLTMARAFTVLSVVCNGALRLRLYSTAAAQTADLNRPNTVPPTPGTNHGVICDLYLASNTQYLLWNLAPVAPGSNDDSPQSTNVYCSITNLGVTTVSLTAAITYVADSQPT
ncbi:MAG: hypothetical protein WA306_09375 [Candidatus Acidiferrales bacterium]